MQALSDLEFRLFRQLIHARTGIALGELKRSLVESRLARRLRELGLPTYGAYYERVAAGTDATELALFINAVTTNVTAFFREPRHFDYLARHWLPGAKARALRGGRRSLRLWSAGCSTGEEAYTLAMVLCEGLRGSGAWDARILASDIDTAALATAAAGRYAAPQLAAVPETLRRRYFRADGGAGCAAAPELAALVAFRHINLLETPWPIRSRLDVIVCRNVMIYFDRPTRERLVQRFEAALADGGVLMLGHSENLLGTRSHLRHLGDTTYEKAA